jgi:DNA-binding NarL/FixJ family response regulator
MDGLTTLPEIKKLYPNVKVIMLSMHNDHSVISKMMEIGANSYLTKESGSEMIYEAIRGVYENDFYFNELPTNTAERLLNAPLNHQCCGCVAHQRLPFELMCEESI